MVSEVLTSRAKTVSRDVKRMASEACQWLSIVMQKHGERESIGHSVDSRSGGLEREMQKHVSTESWTREQ